VNAAAPGRDIIPSTTGQKRKAQKSQKSQVLSSEQPEYANSLALVMVEKNSGLPFADEDVQVSDSNKKQRTTPFRSADQAEAVEQPRPMQ
jgi:hypothetical protein